MRRGGGSWGEEVVEERVWGRLCVDLREVGDRGCPVQAVEELLDLRRQRDLRLRDVWLAWERRRLGLPAAPPAAEPAVVIGIGDRRRADRRALTLERLQGAEVLAVVDQAVRALGLALHPGLDARLVRADAGRAELDQGLGRIVLVPRAVVAQQHDS